MGLNQRKKKEILLWQHESRAANAAKLLCFGLLLLSFSTLVFSASVAKSPANLIKDSAVPADKALGDAALSEDFIGEQDIDTDLPNTEDLSTFDHIATGFPLTGKHTLLDCQVCHLGALFTELPISCQACHNGRLAPGVNRDHIPITDDCDACHTPAGFKIVTAAVFDHSLIGNASCASCHDGIKARGKSALHFTTSDICINCHISTVTWFVTLVDHSGFTGPCIDCHNGTIASGKSALHIPTSNLCEKCHTSVAGDKWTPAIRPVDHTQTIGSCVSCHNGTLVAGKSVLHIVSSDTCDACHSVVVWSPETKVDHDHVIGSCVSCHDGSRGTAKSAQHIRSTDVCEACHLATTWAPLRGGVVNHSEVLGSCSSCHDGNIARGKQATHIVTALDCNACHAKTQWLPVFGAIDHGPFSGNCFTCHDSNTASGKGPRHITTSDVCDACHEKSPVPWIPVAAAAVDHAQVLGTCISCHNNTTAVGRPDTHISTTDNCQNCHGVVPSRWKPVLAAAVDHGEVLGNCISCHNNTPVPGKSPTHIATSDLCEACHLVGPNPWTPVPISKVDHVEVLGSCISCHNNSLYPGKSATHILTTNICEACHEEGPKPWRPILAGRMDHQEVNGICSSCHNNVIARGKHALHIVTTQECNACHGVTAWFPAAADHSSFVNNCISCHDGVNASGKTSFHFPASDVCDACHQKFPANWRPVAAAAVDHAQLTGTCISCHDGGFAPGKSLSHMSTSDNCDACHAAGPTPWVPVLPAAVNHREVQGTCESCHNGIIARGKAGRHSVINTTDNCAACHAASPVAWITVTPKVDHLEVIGVCSSCHDGTIAKGKNFIANHVVTAKECDTCHSSSAWLPAGVDHATFSGNCISCHNGSPISGKSSTHINSSDACDACHDKLPARWVPVAANRVDHKAVNGTCISCHDSAIASGKSQTHILSSTRCDACHQPGPNPWIPVAKTAVNHTAVQGTCISCHNNVIAVGKSPILHMPSSDSCNACHLSGPTPWVPVAKAAVNHAEVVGACIVCHDGGYAVGKSSIHMPTTAKCQACHQVGPAKWIPVLKGAVDHKEVQATCSFCHNTTTATGKPTVNHVVTALECNVCHMTTAWIPATIDHTGFAGNCLDCHTGLIARGKAATHIISSDVCDACHKLPPNKWIPVLAATVDHNQVAGACFACHNNTLYAGKSVNHLPTSDVCEKCHKTTQFPKWLIPLASGVDHLEVQGVCADCHNGTLVRGQGPGHITTSLPCDNCHVTTSWLTTTAVDHATIVTNCIACHDGNTASGKTTGVHIASTNNCELCHQKLPARWVPVAANAVDHSQAIGTCVSCHNNAPIAGKPLNHPATTDVCTGCHNVGPAKWLPLIKPISHIETLGACVDCHTSTGIATGKSATHPTTTNNCIVCHRIPPAAWIPVISPMDHREVLGTCVSCHNNTVTAGKSASHPATNDDCVSCHAVPPTPWSQFLVPLDHTAVLGTCVSCHTTGGVTNATPKSLNHPNTTDMCEACHRPSPSTWLPFISPLDHNQVLGTCVVCHNASGIGTPKTLNHPTTTDVCAACHNFPPSTWLPFITPLDHLEVLGTCVTCHTPGGIATSKSASHPNTTNTCDACHNKPPSSWLPYIAPLNHLEVIGTCISCHTRPAGHPNTTDVCEACHNIPPTSWQSVITPLDHGQVLGTCVSCHTPGGVGTAKSAIHPPTSDLCDACHALPPVLWNSLIILPFAHTEATMALCTDCHATGIATPVNGGHCTPLGGDCNLCHTTQSFANPTGDCAAPPPAPGAPPAPPPAPPAPGMGGPGGMGMGGGM